MVVVVILEGNLQAVEVRFDPGVTCLVALAGEADDDGEREDGEDRNDYEDFDEGKGVLHTTILGLFGKFAKCG